MPSSAQAQVLYVSQVGNGANTGTVSTYDATTGASINPNFVTGVNDAGAILLSGNTLYAASASNGGLISEYNATTGVAINTDFIVNGGGNVGLALSGNDLFVSRSNATVNEYNATTGALITANFIPALATGTNANGIAVAPIPEPSTWSMMAVGGVALLGMMFRKKHRTA